MTMKLLLSLLLVQAPAEPAAGPRRATSVEPLASWVSDSDYPVDALAANAEGTVAFRLVVGADGRVIDCKIEQSSGNSSLDGQTCAIMTARPRFHPARDRRGRPVIDLVRSRIAWRIDPTSGLAPFTSFRFVTAMTLGPSGARCSAAFNGDSRPIPCPATDPELMNTLTRLGSGTTISIVVTQTPAGEPALPRDPSLGSLLSESEAEFTVARDGSIATCRVTQRTVHAAATLPVPPDPCASPTRPRFPPSDSDTARRATVNISVYMAVQTSS